MAFGGIIDIAPAEGMAGELASILPPRVRAPFTATFIRSAGLCDEFVHRLGVGIFRESGLAAAGAAAPGAGGEPGGRGGRAAGPRRARAPVYWMRRRLCARGILERPGAPPRFRLPTAVPELDPAPVREEQERHDPSWRPTYVVAETVAKDYP